MRDLRTHTHAVVVCHLRLCWWGGSPSTFSAVLSDRWRPLVYIPCICCKPLIYLIRSACRKGEGRGGCGSILLAGVLNMREEEEEGCAVERWVGHVSVSHEKNLTPVMESFTRIVASLLCSAADSTFKTGNFFSLFFFYMSVTHPNCVHGPPVVKFRVFFCPCFVHLLLVNKSIKLNFAKINSLWALKFWMKK